MDRFPKNIQMSNLMKTLPVGAELFRTDGQTDKRDQTNNSFSKFSEKATKKLRYAPYQCVHRCSIPYVSNN